PPCCCKRFSAERKKGRHKLTSSCLPLSAVTRSISCYHLRPHLATAFGVNRTLAVFADPPGRQAPRAGIHDEKLPETAVGMAKTPSGRKAVVGGSPGRRMGGPSPVEDFVHAGCRPRTGAR